MSDNIRINIKLAFIIIILIFALTFVLDQCGCLQCIKCKFKCKRTNRIDVQSTPILVNAIPLNAITNEIIVIGEHSHFDMIRENAIVVDAILIN